jgi:hypothetical protein
MQCEHAKGVSLSRFCFEIVLEVQYLRGLLGCGASFAGTMQHERSYATVNVTESRQLFLEIYVC